MRDPARTEVDDLRARATAEAERIRQRAAQVDRRCPAAPRSAPRPSCGPRVPTSAHSVRISSAVRAGSPSGEQRLDTDARSLEERTGELAEIAADIERKTLGTARRRAGAAGRPGAHRRTHRGAGQGRAGRRRRERRPSGRRRCSSARSSARPTRTARARAREIITLAIQRLASEQTAESVVVGAAPAGRRDEGPHHRARGPQHPGLRAGHRRQPDHRRHPRGGPALLLRPSPPGGRPADARGARARRPHPPAPDRGAVRDRARPRSRTAVRRGPARTPWSTSASPTCTLTW